MEYILIIISAVFVNNILLSQFLGVCPFLGVSKKVSTALGMSAAVTFVMALATCVTYLLQYYVLVPLGIEFLQTVCFILVIAGLVGSEARPACACYNIDGGFRRLRFPRRSGR